MSAKRPNILFVQADQMAAPALPFHGHAVVKAPHMAALAEAGVVFENAYCNSPLCAPSRFSMLAGLMPSEIGAYDNAAEFPASVPTFAHRLRRLGYRTVLAGKMHFVGPDQLHGFEERLTTDIYPADFGWTPNWDEPEARQDYFHTMSSVVEAGPCARSMQIDFDDEVAFRARRKIYDVARGADERPFFLTVSFTHPHDPYTIGQAYWDRYDHDAIDTPASPAIPYQERDPHSRRLYRCTGMDAHRIGKAHVRNARHAYYGAISHVDDKLGELLGALAATGFADNTIVVFTSDHGDMLGKHGLWAKRLFYEESAQVPMILVGTAAQGRDGTVACDTLDDRLVGWQDVMPTLLGLAGVPVPDAVEGLCDLAQPCDVPPELVGDRLWVVTNRCELMCLDLNGFYDGENDGPYKEETDKEMQDADIVWRLDMIEDLGVFPHNLATSSPVVYGDYVYLVTSNGVDEAHLTIPVPEAPSFIAV
ncbi:MAG: choline-sulfatase, partial [Proteobacteria bacterium]|nr:choline-sulfatase [Pseudomonadota bacterium]